MPKIKGYRSVCFLACLMLLGLLLGLQANSLGKSEGGAVHALFNLTTPAVGPFPSNRFTVADPSHNTGLRVNLPKPDCAERPSDCEDMDVLNTLDGFNLQPRLSIPFDGPIDVLSVTTETVFLISLGNTLDPRDRGGRRIGVNQIVWDPRTNTLHVESDELLDQHTRYVLIVTRGVRDRSGRPVAASVAFRRFVLARPFDLFFGGPEEPVCGWSQDCALKEYRRKLVAALGEARRAGVWESEVVSASLFTTQSATAILEKIRDQIKAATPAPADFRLGAGGTRTVFHLGRVSSITWNQQTRDNPQQFTAVQVPVGLLSIIPGAVGQIAFGKYLSPDYTVHPGEYIPPVGTHTGTPVVQGMAEIYFNLYLPSGPRPTAGWPVAIFGHGSGGSKQGTAVGPASLAVAATMAEHGIATVAINVMGHGFGPLGTLRVQQASGESMAFPDGGRGIDQNHDGQIGGSEGGEALLPRILQQNRDGVIRTLGDLMQLVRVIKVGMDVDGDGSRDLDSSRIYYFGASLGGMYGADLMAVEPHVRAAVLNVPGGPGVENRRLATTGLHQELARLFAARQPSLINSPGITSIDGVALPGPPFFNENMPLRNGVPLAVGLADGTSREIQSPVVNATAGAMALQEWFDRAAWAAQAVNPVAYAPHLRQRPLPGVSARPVLFQLAKGDQNVSNANTTAMLRAGDLADRATFYRHDLAYAEIPGLPKNPHLFTLGVANAASREIALGAQRQIAVFFASDGAVVIHPEPARFFEVPITSPLPEGLNYIP